MPLSSAIVTLIRNARDDGYHASAARHRSVRLLRHSRLCPRPQFLPRPARPAGAEREFDALRLAYSQAHSMATRTRLDHAGFRARSPAWAAACMPRTSRSAATRKTAPSRCGPARAATAPICCAATCRPTASPRRRVRTGGDTGRWNWGIEALLPLPVYGKGQGGFRAAVRKSASAPRPASGSRPSARCR